MSFWRVYYHIVWATKEREPFIQPEIEAQLYTYLSGKAVKKLKGASSFYINHVIKPGCGFAWQRGYGVFSLGESQLDQAVRYVENQKIHHTQQTTNSWLERMAEFDEGPPGIDDSLNVPASKLREAQAVYHIVNEPPF